MWGEVVMRRVFGREGSRDWGGNVGALCIACLVSDSTCRAGPDK
jgi:hypothetical protein